MSHSDVAGVPPGNHLTQTTYVVAIRVSLLKGTASVDLKFDAQMTARHDRKRLAGLLPRSSLRAYAPRMHVMRRRLAH